jgi:hypothetical protein
MAPKNRQARLLPATSRQPAARSRRGQCQLYRVIRPYDLEMGIEPALIKGGEQGGLCGPGLNRTHKRCAMDGRHERETMLLPRG